MSCPRCPEGYVSCTFCMRLPAKRECPGCGLTWTCVCGYEAVRDSERLRAMAPAPAPARPFKQTREWNERAAAEEGDHDISAGPAQPEHDAEVEAREHEVFAAGAQAEREVCVQEALSWPEGVKWPWASADPRGVCCKNHIATAKAEGYREGLAAGRAIGWAEGSRDAYGNAAVCARHATSLRRCEACRLRFKVKRESSTT